MLADTRERTAVGSRVATARPESRRGILLSSTAVGALFLLLTLWTSAPHEDAAMLFAYSENLARGHGVVFNPGGPPVDGASDLLFMAAVAALVSLGAPTTAAASILNALGAAAVFASSRWAWSTWGGVGPVWSTLVGLVLCLGPMLAIAVAGFGIAFFTGLLSITTVVALLYARSESHASGLIVGLLIAISGFDRIEGFVLGGLLTLSIAIAYRSMRLVVIPGLVAGFCGLVFVAARWVYFGYPLPNPYYKKGGAALYLDSIPPSITNLVLAAAPWIAILLLAVFTSVRRQAWSYLLVVGVGWGALWMLLSNETNFLGRFQFPVVPVLAILAATVYPAGRSRLASARALVAIPIVALTALVTAFSLVLPNLLIIRDQISAHDLHESLAVSLRPFAGDGSRTIAVTEAGFAAWKSDWNVIDLWGLNDQTIAHGGYLDESQLDALEPELLFVHLPAGPESSQADSGKDSFLVGWNQMSDPVVCLATRASYQLIGSWQRGPDDWFFLFARPDLPDGRELARAVENVRGPSANRRALGPPPLPTDCRS